MGKTSRSKTVRLADGRKTTIQAPLTLEEYRERESNLAPASFPTSGAKRVSPPPATPTPLEEARAILGPKGTRLVRSRGENLPKIKCSQCGRLTHEHPVEATQSHSFCPRLVVFRDDNEWLLDEPPDDCGSAFEFAPLDECEQTELRIPPHLLRDDDDEVPAGMTPEDVEAQREEAAEREGRAEEHRQFEEEVAAWTAYWRAKSANQPPDLPHRGRRRAC